MAETVLDYLQSKLPTQSIIGESELKFLRSNSHIPVMD